MKLVATVGITIPTVILVDADYLTKEALGAPQATMAPVCCGPCDWSATKCHHLTPVFTLYMFIFTGSIFFLLLLHTNTVEMVRREKSRQFLISE